VDNPAGHHARFTPNGNDEAPIPHRHRRIGDAVMRLEPLHLSFENGDQLTLRGAELPTNASQRGRRVVFDTPILENRPVDSLFERLNGNQCVEQRRKERTNDPGSTVVTQLSLRLSRRP
jgi:hypothetical protein